MSESTTKKDQVLENLRRRIASGEISRGSRIQQQAVAKELQTSITPVREALKQLQAEGLLEGEPNRGVRVASVNLEQLKGNYIIRRLVEPYAIKRATMGLSRRDLSKAWLLNDGMAEAHAAKDDELATELNREFHFLLYSKTGIRSLLAEIESLWFGFPWDILQVLERVEQSIEEHQNILSALEGHDADKAGELTANHIARSYKALHEHLSTESHEEYRDPFEIDEY